MASLPSALSKKGRVLCLASDRGRDGGQEVTGKQEQELLWAGVGQRWTTTTPLHVTSPESGHWSYHPPGGWLAPGRPWLGACQEVPQRAGFYVSYAGHTAGCRLHYSDHRHLILTTTKRKGEKSKKPWWNSTSMTKTLLKVIAEE